MKSTNLFFEDSIKETLDKNAEHIMASETLKHRVDRVIKNQDLRRESPLKNILTIKRVAVTVAALCFMMPAVAFAIGHINSYVSTSSSTLDYVEMPTAKELTKDIGFAPKATDAFTNGFSFENAHVDNIQGKDENGNVVEEFKGIDYIYVASDDSKITLSANNNQYPSLEDDANKPNAQTEVYKGIDLTYSEQQYKFVPLNYEMTAQDKKDEARGAVTFSNGSEQVEIEMFKFLSWSDRGINYLLMGSDIDLAQDDFVEMAKEIINR